MKVNQNFARVRTGAILTFAILIVAGTMSLFNPLAPAGAAFTADDCAQAQGYPDRTEADQAWLAQCAHALRPYVAPTPSETATPTPTPEPSETASPTPTAQPTMTPSATPTPTGPPVPTDTYTVNGRWLYDPLGNKVIPRGSENSMWNASWLPYSLINESAKTGANTIRILPYYLNTPPCSGCTKTTVAQIEDMIKRGLSSKMLVDVGIDGGNPDVLLRPEIKTLLFKYQSRIVVHAKGESYEATDALWRTASINAITSLRAAGYTMPLYIMSRQGGRDLKAIINEGANIVAADPLHRIVLGWQAYWGSNGAYQSQQQMTLTEAMNSAASLPFPVQVGMIYRSDPQDGSSQTVPFSNLFALAQSLQLGWLWWDWRIGIDNLTTDGLYGHWAKPGQAGLCAAPCNPNLLLGQTVALDDTNSISHTSVRTEWMLAYTP